MIDEDRTMQLFGYTSSDLKPRSHKPIVSVCEECGAHRIADKWRANQLCKRCSVTDDKNPFFGKHHSEETKHKLAERVITDETRQKISDNHADVNGSNNPFFGKHHTEESKRKAALNSPDQSGKNNPMYGVHLFGELHWNWQGGITPRMTLIRNSQSYKNWRNAIFKRDNYTCQMCGMRGGNLEAHHIHPVRDHKNTLLIYDVSNGITLCVDCHQKTFEKEYEFAEQFENKLRM